MTRTINADGGRERTAEITTIDVDVDGMTGFNEPVKLAHIQVRIGEEVTNVLGVRNYERRETWDFKDDHDGEIWVSECWALEADENWNPKKFPGGAGSNHNELFHWSSKGLADWDDVVRSVEENLHLIDRNR